MITLRKKYLLLLLTTCLLALAGGCAPYHANPWTEEVEAYDVSPSAGHYAKVSPDQMIVYAGPSFAPRKYELVARLRSASNGDWLPEDVLKDEFKKKASQLGADAVVILDITHEVKSRGAQFETGQQPLNDLGYRDHSHSTAVTVVVPPTPEAKTAPGKLCKGTALAIRSAAGP